MYLGRLREMALEEGGKATISTVTQAAWTWARHRRWPWRAYLVVWTPLLVTAALRPEALVELPPVPSAASLAPLYAHMPSTEVTPETDLAPVWRDIGRQAQTLNMSCLAAVHIGVPLRAALVASTVRLVNPVLVSGVGRHRLSAAYETSAFFPDRAPVRVVREIPVTVRDAYQAEHVFDSREDAHCILHVLDAFEGRTPYDVGEPVFSPAG